MASSAPSGFVIPGGKSKDTPIEQATERDLLYWVGRISKEIADGGSRRPDHDKKWIAAARAVLEGKGVDPGQSMPSGGGERSSSNSNAGNGNGNTASRPRHKLADAQSFSDSKELLALLSAIEADYNVVGAVALGEVPLGHSVVLSVVRIHPQEWHKQENGFGLAGSALSRIADAAGVSTTATVQTEYDPKGMCCFKVSIARQELSGGVRGKTMTGRIDLRPGTKEYETLLEEGRERRQNAINKNWDRIPREDGQIRAKLKHLAALTESKGYNRAVRKLLALDRSFTEIEKTKPFAVLKLSFTGRCPENPALERMFARGLMQASLGGVAALFGRAGGMGATQLAPAARPAGLLHGGPPQDAEFDEEDDDDDHDDGPASDPAGSDFGGVDQPYGDDEAY